MFASFLAAFFFALNASCASYSVRSLGPLWANLGRLTVAAVALGAFAHLWGGGLTSASVPWFLLSGLIGMGLGDLGVYGALPFLGSRLTVLMTQCLAAPIAAVGEWIWLDTRLTGAQVIWGLLVLAGVILALLPGGSGTERGPLRPAGLLFGLLAAAGQGLGALVSRKGVTVAELTGESVAQASFGITAAYQRILAGFVFIVLWFGVLRLLGRLPSGPGFADSHSPLRTPRTWGWMVANGLAGPVCGVGCYQWALATTPSGLVLPIAATAPLLAIPIAYVLEGDRPTRRALLGGVVAVAGCIALTATR